MTYKPDKAERSVGASTCKGSFMELTTIDHIAIAVVSVLSLVAFYAVGLLYLKWSNRDR